MKNEIKNMLRSPEIGIFEFNTGMTPITKVKLKKEVVVSGDIHLTITEYEINGSPYKMNWIKYCSQFCIDDFTDGLIEHIDDDNKYYIETGRVLFI